VRTYSHGMRARLRWRSAASHRDLLILDSERGLDPEGDSRDAPDNSASPSGTGPTSCCRSLSERVEQIWLPHRLLNRGRKVFERLAGRHQASRAMAALEKRDFAQAAGTLRQVGADRARRDGQFIALKPGAGSDEVSRFLSTRHGRFMKSPRGRTLEAFI